MVEFAFDVDILVVVVAAAADNSNAHLFIIYAFTYFSFVFIMSLCFYFFTFCFCLLFSRPSVPFCLVNYCLVFCHILLHQLFDCLRAHTQPLPACSSSLTASSFCDFGGQIFRAICVLFRSRACSFVCSIA